jgi:hypothetical protein
MSIIVDKKPNFGLWKGEIENADPREYRRGKISDAWLGAREKRWQYVGLFTEEFIVGIAVVHASYLGNVFCYVYDKQSDLLWEQERTSPAGFGIRVDRNVSKGVVSYLTDTECIRFDNDIPLSKRMVDVRLHSEGRDVDIRVEILDSFQDSTPLQVVTPTQDGDFTFTHKSTALPILGSIRLGNKRYELTPENDFAVIDFTFGFPSRDTFWNWASFAGRSKCGQRVGLNLVDPIFDPQYNENAFWVDGKLIKVNKAIFEYDKDDVLKPWKIRTEDSLVDLTFVPKRKREQSIDYKVLSSQFQQPFGHYSGVLTIPGIGKVIIDNVSGVVEEHHARW